MFKGLGQLGDMAKIMGQAQEMQKKMQDAQDALELIEVSGESGAGMVKAVVTAKGKLKSLEIDPSLLTGDDKEVVEDLIVAAVNDGQIRAAEKSKEEMGKITQGLNLPEGMNLPF